MIYSFGDCALDTNLYTLQRGGQTFRLRLKVFRMCLYLLEHRDRVVSREELCTQVWPGQFVSQATLEGVIRLVRQAVGDSGRTQSIIQTLHGHGYRFVARVDECPMFDVEAELPLASGSPIIPEPALSAREAVLAGGVVAVDEPELSLSSDQPEQDGFGYPGENNYDTDTREGLLHAAQWGRDGSGEWRWWMPRLGLGLAFVILLLLGGWFSWGGSAQWTVALDKSRIAVLPFIDLSTEPDQPYVADGLTENLIAELARIQGLTVIARTSVMKYKGSLKDVATIGRELRVGTILEGSVRRVHNQVRISAQLIDVASQGYLWSQEYEREVAEVYDIRSDIAARVAKLSKVQVTASPIIECPGAEQQSATMVQKIDLAH